MIGSAGVVADDRDDRAFGADDDVIFESHFSHQFDDVVDLSLGRAGLHDDDHRGASVVEPSEEEEDTVHAF